MLTVLTVQNFEGARFYGPVWDAGKIMLLRFFVLWDFSKIVRQSMHLHFFLAFPYPPAAFLATGYWKLLHVFQCML